MTKLKDNNRRLKAVDLFCGIGGFHEAAKDTFIDVVFASEIDKFAAKKGGRTIELIFEKKY